MLSGEMLDFIELIMVRRACDVIKYFSLCSVYVQCEGFAILTASSVATQFKSSLTLLMADINQTNVSYVRCIKPNPNKSPGKIVHKPILKYILINLYKPYSV